MAVLQLLTLVLLELVQLIYLSEASSLSTIVLLRASRSNSYRGRRMYDEQEYNEFNEDLEITKVTYADEIVRNASPIVVLQSADAKLLYLSKRVHADITLPASFITARVQSPDIDEMQELVRVFQYLKHTRDMGI